MSGQGRNAKRQGAQSNELYQLQALNRIVNAITGTGQPPAPLGIATEATLQSLLAATIAADQDFEILLVRDTGDGDVVVQQITDWTTGVPVVSYKKVDGSTHIVVGPMEYLDPAAVLNLLLTESLDQGVSLDTLNANIVIIDAVLDAIKTDTANLDVALSTRATEATLASVLADTTALLAKFGSLGQKASAGSAPVVLSTEQEAIMTAIDTVLDNIKLDTAALVVDAAASEAILITIDAVLDNIKIDTAAMVVDLAAIEVLLTTMDNVLDSIALGVHAIDSPVGGTDSGMAMLNKHEEDLVHTSTADGDYEITRSDSLGRIYTNPEGVHIFDTMNVITGWSALDTDTTNLATTKKHILGTDAVSFDKANTAANNTLALIEKTLPATDLGKVSPQDILQMIIYLPSLTNVTNVVARLGTDASNYNQWKIPVDALAAATFETLAFVIGDADHAGITGNGWDESAVTYIAVGIEFDSETATLAGIIFDHLSYHTNTHVTTSLSAEVTSDVSTPNVNLQKVGGSVVDKNAGNASNGTQRVVIATDDPNLGAGSRTHNYINSAGSGTIPAGSIRGSISNIGSEDAEYKGVTLPAGVTIPWGEVGNRDTYGSAAYDATTPGAGTTLLIEYTT